jgi:uncharacterized protein (DUF58 family)
VGDYFFVFLVIVVLVAALLREDFVLTLFYFLIGSYAISRWWSERAFKSVTVGRAFNNRAFLHDPVTITLVIKNTSRLPVVWLRLHESLPVELVGSDSFRRVVSLGPRGQRQFQYTVHPGRRGYYQIGPLFLYSGDVLGLSEERARQGAPDFLTVYPRIVPLSRINLPSHSPMGTLRHHQPIFEDPTRVRGKRDYVAGDSLRRVDWKATATSGRLQVKQFEPSIALETAIFLNLNANDYYYRTRNDATELAIIAAASMANWVIGQKQTVGLISNGSDALSSDGRAPILLPEKGRGHLMHMLDVLARVQMTQTGSFVALLQRQRVHLAWGTTMILITGDVDNALFDELFAARRAGLNVVLVLCGHVIEAQAIKRRAEHFGIPVHHLNSEKDMDVWRK